MPKKEKKAAALVLQGSLSDKGNLNKSVKVELTKDDIINVHIAKYETAKEAEREEVIKQLSELSKEIKVLSQDKLDKAREKFVKKQYESARSKFEKLLHDTTEDNSKVEVRICGINHDGTISCELRSSLRGSNNVLRLKPLDPDVTIQKITDELKSKREKQDELQKKEWEITSQLDNIEREARKAKAKMTEALLQGSDISNLLPSAE